MDHRLEIAGDWLSTPAKDAIRGKEDFYAVLIGPALPRAMAANTNHLAAARRDDGRCPVANTRATMANTVRELVREQTIPCPRCGGEQEVAESHVADGFAGGYVETVILACGHGITESAGDTLASA